MLTLGIHPGYHDASACLFDGYKLVAAVSRERLTRSKGDGRGDVPEDCVDEVLAIAGASRRKIMSLSLPAHLVTLPPSDFRRSGVACPVKMTIGINTPSYSGN
ncbi:MAG: hypothetical protein HOI34_13380 [Rhodospirillaceae bacterium]|nr:hypothetical protein [Rhodospirillaceae bacterium]